MLLVGLAVEGATIPALGQFLSVHIFVGMLLLGPVALKLASVAYRLVRYYTAPASMSARAPTPVMRVVVAPILVLSTLTLFGTGVGLLAFPHRGALSGLRKASFIVWFGAMTIHLLAYGIRAGRDGVAELAGRYLQGRALRLAGAGLALAVGIAIALATYPLAGAWFHHGHGPG